jgi:hypothetical protein
MIGLRVAEFVLRSVGLVSMTTKPVQASAFRPIRNTVIDIPRRACTEPNNIPEVGQRVRRRAHRGGKLT